MNKNALGFSLLEIIIIMAIIVTIIGFSIPSLTPILEKKSVEQTAKKLLQSFELAQITASRISDITLICPLSSASSQREQKPCSTGEWQNGWALYQPDREAKNNDLILIKKFDAPTHQTKIKTTLQRIIFKKDGFIHSPIKNTILVCHPRHSKSWTSIQVQRKGIDSSSSYSLEESTQC